MPIKHEIDDTIFAKIEHVWLECRVTIAQPLQFVVVQKHPVWHGCVLKRSQVDRIRELLPQ